MAPWRAVAGGVLLTLRVTPKSARDAIEGIETLSDGLTVLKLRVRALPTDGQANDAVAAVFSKALKLPKSSVVLERGGASRVKTLRLAGDPVRIIAKLEEITKQDRQ